MQRGDRRLGLELAEAVLRESRLQDRDALGDQRRVPPAAVLLGERDEAAVRAGARGAAGVVQQHERQQAGDLGSSVRACSWRVSRIASAARSTSPE